MKLLVVRLPIPRHLPMLRLAGPWRICSHYVDCRSCDHQIEGIGSSPAEAEKRAWDLFAAHCTEYHISIGAN